MFDDNKNDCRMESSREQSSPAAAQESPGEPLLAPSGALVFIMV